MAPKGHKWSFRAISLSCGLHSGAVSQVKQLAAALARCKGSDEGEVASSLPAVWEIISHPDAWQCPDALHALPGC